MWLIGQMQLKRRLLADGFMLLTILLFLVIGVEMNALAIGIPLLIIRHSNSLNDSKLFKLQLTMPILLKHLVQARYIYDIISFYIISGALLVVAIIQSSISVFTAMCFFTSFIIVFNTFCAQAIYVDFSTIKKPGFADYIFGIFPAGGLIFIHIILVVIEIDNVWWKWLLLLPVPILSFYFLAFYYKRAITQISQKEFI